MHGIVQVILGDVEKADVREATVCVNCINTAGISACAALDA